MAADNDGCYKGLQGNVLVWLNELEFISSRMLSKKPETKTEEFSNAAEASKLLSLKLMLPERKNSRLSTYKKRDSILSLMSSHLGFNALCRNKPEVHYDGDLQSSFEKVVNGIIASRSMVRKERLHLQSQQRDLPSTNDQKAKASSNRNSMASISALRQLGLMDDPEVDLQRIDRYLEEAQDSCERGAFQLLRDGECCNQVKVVKGWFSTIADICGKHTGSTSGGSAMPLKECQPSIPEDVHQEITSSSREEAPNSSSLDAKAPTGDAPNSSQTHEIEADGDVMESDDGSLSDLRLQSKTMAAKRMRSS